MNALKALRNSHLKNLRSVFDAYHDHNEPQSVCAENIHIENNQLKEYFQHMHNSIDLSECQRIENQKAKKVKLNENVLKEHQLQQKRFDIDWNLEYCNACKISYWPLNCTVYIQPKCRLNYKNAKLLTKYKLFNYKPKYKSYKDTLLKNLLKKGIKLIYECRRCKTKNVILNELKRVDTKEIRLTKEESKKNLDKLIKSSEFSFNSSSAKLSNGQSGGAIIINKKMNARKKFQSLQTKLKQNEQQQELIRKEQEKNKNRFGTLADFLQQIT